MHHICETMKKKKEGKVMVSDDYRRRKERAFVFAREQKS